MILFYKRALCCFTLLTTLISCANNDKLEVDTYCESMKKVVEKDYNAQKLEDWFDQNFDNRIISKENYTFGGRYFPGLYTYEKSFEWNMINFDELESIIKIVKFDKIDTVGSRMKVDSIALAENSRKNIMVKSAGSDSYGLGEDSRFIIDVTDRVAILCMDVGF